MEALRMNDSIVFSQEQTEFLVKAAKFNEPTLCDDFRQGKLKFRLHPLFYNSRAKYRDDVTHLFASYPFVLRMLSQSETAGNAS